MSKIKKGNREVIFISRKFLFIHKQDPVTMRNKSFTSLILDNSYSDGILLRELIRKYKS